MYICETFSVRRILRINVRSIYVTLVLQHNKVDVQPRYNDGCDQPFTTL